MRPILQAMHSNHTLRRLAFGRNRCSKALLADIEAMFLGNEYGGVPVAVYSLRLQRSGGI